MSAVAYRQTEYKCSNDHLFLQVEAGRASDSFTGEAWGATFCETETFLICPVCGNEDLEEI